MMGERTSSVLLPHGVLSLNSLVLLVSCVAVYLVVSAIYALTLHPLAGIPGPKLCAITRLPYWIAYVQGRDVKWLHRLHTQYGPEVRFGPTDVSYTSAEAWKDVDGSEKGRPENEKAQEFSVQPVNGVYSMQSSNYADHARVRDLFSPAFSERALRRQEPLFRKYVDLLIARVGELGEEGARPVEMTRMFNFTTFDIMAELCFGQSLGMLQSNAYSQWVQAIFESLKMLPFATMIAYYPLLGAVFRRVEPRSVTRMRAAHCRYSADRVDRRLAHGSDRPDIWNLVTEAEGSARALTLPEMHSNAELFMIAGSETAATLLSGVTYYLLTTPGTLARLRAEVRGRFARYQDLGFEPLAGLRYLNAVLREGLRIYPPVPIGSPRVVRPGGQAVLGRWLPGGTRVSVHHYATYHSARNFADPDTFAPDRWLAGTEHDADPRYARDRLDAHQPFSTGPRNCLGQNMAMHEMRLTLAALVWSYDLELCPESIDWPDQQAFALWLRNKLLVRLTPVQR
ncbi:cytochrome P450 [Xylariomycetidae sp. FL0641]|nr:cytochrome P450 [Xylariomycetidae sp. FL0641]